MRVARSRTSIIRKALRFVMDMGQTNNKLFFIGSHAAPAGLGKKTIYFCLYPVAKFYYLSDLYNIDTILWEEINHPETFQAAVALPISRPN